MKPIFILIFALFATSCQILSDKDINELEKKRYKELVENSCFSSDIGSFLMNVAQPNAPSVSMEGKWTQNFSKLKTQLLDPTGRVLATDPISEIIEKFGPHGLRAMMCGQTGFEPTLKLDGHKIVVKSKMRIIKMSEETILETESEFYYGLFAKKNKNTLFWRGRIQQRKVIPELIRFGSGSDFVTLDFIDYE